MDLDVFLFSLSLSERVEATAMFGVVQIDFVESLLDLESGVLVL